MQPHAKISKLFIKIGLSAIICLHLSHVKAQNSLATMKDLTDSINAIMKQEHIPGLMLGITSKDSVLFSGGLGYADLKSRRPVDSNSLFRLASISKMFVSLAILKLAEEGRFSLDDPLRKIAPEVPFSNPWEKDHPVRIVNLLEHTSGFDDIKLNTMYNTSGHDINGLHAVMTQKSSLVCRWKPGERYAYSNPNYTILGYIIEKYSGKPYARYIAENIFKPLEMHNSNFDMHIRHKSKDAKEYEYYREQYHEIPRIPVMDGAFAGLKSCAPDMLKFIRMFLNDGQPAFDENLIHTMETPTTNPAITIGLKTGYAKGNEPDPGFNTYLYRGHRGFIGNCTSACEYSRESGYGFIISANTNCSLNDIEDVIVAYLEQDVTARHIHSIALNISAIKPYLGFYEYESPRHKFIEFKEKLMSARLVYIKNGALFTRSITGKENELVQIAPNIFAQKHLNAPEIAFETRNGKRIMLAEGEYYEKGSLWWGISKRVLMVIAIFPALFSIISGIITLFGYIFGRVEKLHLHLNTIPLFAMIFLACAAVQIYAVEQQNYLLYKLNSIDFSSLTIFLGTILFAVLVVLNLFLIIRKYKKIQHPWLRYYLAVTALSLFIICIFMLQNNLIGLRTWAM
jgi:CubicO group peptidase (beta-lactamase class C family)